VRTRVSAARLPGPAALLGIERSLGDLRWQERPGDARQSLAIAQRCGLPEILGRLLAGRGITADGAAAYLAPALRTMLPDPSRLKDMDRAAGRLADAVAAGERIAVFGDYDVDGATATALFLRYLRGMGQDPLFHIPDRMAEGYGPNAAALAAFRDAGATLIATVDCGTTAFDVLEEASAAGTDVLIFDHHVADSRLPAVHAVVNPNRLDESPGLEQLAACGIVFLALVATTRALRQRSFFADRPEPDLLSLLDLVALGTVCDVVPLVGLNRALVGQGLKVMGRRRNPGIAALADIAGVGQKMDAYHLGFALGPRINAGGRLGRAALGTELLATDDPVEAARIAALLDSHNGDRKEVERSVLEAAIADIERRDGAPGILIAAGEGWHAGVIGIVAGRLKERFGRPACVVAIEAGIGRGSGRSVPEIDLGAAILEARHRGLVLTGGGHRMAAGFTLRADGMPDFAAFLQEWAAETLPGGPPVPVLDIDGTLALEAATPELVDTVRRLGPFGAGNPEPRFVLPAVRVVEARVVGETHVAATLAGADGGRLRAIAFRCLDRPIGARLLARDGALLHVAGTLSVDRWNDRERVQLSIVDAADPWAADPRAADPRAADPRMAESP
jgi:single-stranded-DNA-specific exonuclease